VWAKLPTVGHSPPPRRGHCALRLPTVGHSPRGQRRVHHPSTGRVESGHRSRPSEAAGLGAEVGEVHRIAIVGGSRGASVRARNALAFLLRLLSPHPCTSHIIRHRLIILAPPLLPTSHLTECAIVSFATYLFLE
jgi:hypothetical protein